MAQHVDDQRDGYKARLMSRVVENQSGCWVWQGYTNIHGYACARFHGIQSWVHRVAYVVFVGTIPDGYEIDHLCKVRNCINPAHLEAVTPRVNKLRSNAESARNAMKTVCKHGHPFSADNTRLNGGRRICVACKSVTAKRYRDRQLIHS